MLTRDHRETIIDRMQRDREFCAALLDEHAAELAAAREVAGNDIEDLAKNTAQLLLAAGEMTAQELRTARAVLGYAAFLVRSGRRA